MTSSPVTYRLELFPLCSVELSKLTGSTCDLFPSNPLSQSRHHILPVLLLFTCLLVQNWCWNSGGRFATSGRVLDEAQALLLHCFYAQFHCSECHAVLWILWTKHFIFPQNRISVCLTLSPVYLCLDCLAHSGGVFCSVSESRTTQASC